MTTGFDVKRQWPEHLGLIASAATVFAIAFRVLAMGRFDPLTAAAIVSAGGAGDVALASIIASIPALAVLVLGGGTGIVVGFALRERAVPWMLLVVLSPAWLLLVFFSPIWFSALMLAALLTGWLVSRRPAEGDGEGTPGERGTGSSIPTWGLLVPLTMTFLMSFSMQPYLPSEAIDPASAEPFKGFVVGERDDEVLILGDDEKHAGVHAYPEDTTERSVCRDRQTWTLASPASLFTDHAISTYPKCP